MSTDINIRMISLFILVLLTDIGVLSAKTRSQSSSTLKGCIPGASLVPLATFDPLRARRAREAYLKTKPLRRQYYQIQPVGGTVLSARRSIDQKNEAFEKLWSSYDKVRKIKAPFWGAVASYESGRAMEHLGDFFMGFPSFQGQGAKAARKAIKVNAPKFYGLAFDVYRAAQDYTGATGLCTKYNRLINESIDRLYNKKSSS